MGEGEYVLFVFAMQKQVDACCLAAARERRESSYSPCVVTLTSAHNVPAQVAHLLTDPATNSIRQVAPAVQAVSNGGTANGNQKGNGGSSNGKDLARMRSVLLSLAKE